MLTKLAYGRKRRAPSRVSRNYQQVVSLMTQKDVSEEDSKSPEGKHTRQSWSRVLIESGLSKQQAFVSIQVVYLCSFLYLTADCFLLLLLTGNLGGCRRRP